MLVILLSCNNNADNSADSIYGCKAKNDSEKFLCHLGLLYDFPWEAYYISSTKEDKEYYRLLYFEHTYEPTRIGYRQVFISEEYLINNETGFHFYDSINNGIESESYNKINRGFPVAYWPELDTFQLLLTKSNFWELEENCDYCKNVADGYSFFLEGTKDGKTKMVHRMIPDFMASKVKDSTEAAELMNFYLLCRQMAKL